MVQQLLNRGVPAAEITSVIRMMNQNPGAPMPGSSSGGAGHGHSGSGDYGGAGAGAGSGEMSPPPPEYGDEKAGLRGL